MKGKISLLLIALIGLWATSGTIAQSAKGYTIGDAITNFQVQSVDGRTISLTDYANQKGIIVVFLSNHCPFGRAYEERITALDRQFAPQGYPVLAILPNDPTAYESDSFANLKAHAQEKNLPFAYTIDESQAVAKAFGATRTPEVYVLNRVNGQFLLEYVGAIDDNPQDGNSVQRRYVGEAVTSLLAGRPVQSPFTKPLGCAIKWKQPVGR